MTEKIYQKGKFLSLEWTSEGVMGGEREKRRMDWSKHKEVKLVHEVKMKVYSRDEARHTEKSDLWP